MAHDSKSKALHAAKEGKKVRRLVEKRGDDFSTTRSIAKHIEKVGRRDGAEGGRVFHRIMKSLPNK